MTHFAKLRLHSDGQTSNTQPDVFVFDSGLQLLTVRRRFE